MLWIAFAILLGFSGMVAVVAVLGFGLLVILVVLLFATVPVWPYSRR